MDSININIIIAVIQAIIAYLSWKWSTKKYKLAKYQSHITRLTDIYLAFLNTSPYDKFAQGVLFLPYTANLLVYELSQQDKQLLSCTNEAHLLTFNDVSTEALALNSAIKTAKDKFSIFYRTISLYINSSKYFDDLNNASKVTAAKFKTEITIQSLMLNPDMRTFYNQQLEQSEGMKKVFLSLDDLKTALDDDHFDTHFHNYFVKISS